MSALHPAPFFREATRFFNATMTIQFTDLASAVAIRRTAASSDSGIRAWTRTTRLEDLS